MKKKHEKEHQKKFEQFKKNTCKVLRNLVYLESCDMIAKKREVATEQSVGFPWSECQVRKLATSHCTNL